MKRHESTRLSTTVNPRFDVVAPKKELEKAERQIETVRKEAQKNFEREKKQLAKKLDTLPSTKYSTAEAPGFHKVSRNPLLQPMDGGMSSSQSRRASLTSGVESSVRSQKFSGAYQRPSQINMASMLGGLQGTSSKNSLFPEFLTTDEGQTPADKQSDALRQLKFISDSAAQLVAGAEAGAHRKTSVNAAVSVMKLDSLPDAESDRILKERKALVKKRLTNDLSQAASTDMTQRKISRGARYSGLRSSASADVTADSQQRKESVQRRISRNAGKTPTMSDLRSPSVISTDTLDSTSVTPQGAMTDFQGPTSQAVQLMSMIRILALGHAMDPKGVKALTSVIEESRNAVKAVKGGMEPERAQERLVKKLHELLEVVKPHGSDLIIPPEELLRCSYLRLSKDNIERLEEMIREKGYDPGIHCHTNIKSYLENIDFDKAPVGGITLHVGEYDVMKTLQPMSIYLTKAGAPIDRSRTAKPDSVPGPSMDEEMARLKKFRAT